MTESATRAGSRYATASPGAIVRLGGALFLVPVVGVTAGILRGDRPGQAELIGIVALAVGIGIASIGGARATSTDGAEPQAA